MESNTHYKLTSRPVSGAGIGLRPQHLDFVLEHKPAVNWFEVLTDNYFGPEGEALADLEQIRSHYPITMHSVGMSVGSTDPINWDYVGKIKALADRFQPAWVSEHLCWTSAHGVNFHDLLPLPYTEETINHVAGRISKIQDFLGRRLLIENVSSYLTFKESQMPEAEFVSAVAEKADCGILLDVNNIFVSQYNHGDKAMDYIRSTPAERVGEIHLAGGEERDGYMLDTHSREVPDDVWEIYRAAIEHCGDTPSLIEWDNDIPEFSVLAGEASKAEYILNPQSPQYEATG